MKEWVFWRLTDLRDRVPFLARPLDYMRYEWFYPYL
jgi:hypothetical protein